MSFGLNRDYKRTADRVKKNLARHAEIMAALMAKGMSKEGASAEAMRQMGFGAKK
jgi:hypothetical protein